MIPAVAVATKGNHTIPGLAVRPAIPRSDSVDLLT